MHSWAVIQRQELEAAEDGGGLLCVLLPSGNGGLFVAAAQSPHTRADKG